MGEITGVALMGTDVERIVSGMQKLHEVWASLLDIGIATWLLEKQLSLACIAPIVVVAGMYIA
jgi:ATP-binding cassette, subfamily C (CFTR/MRP), member 1